MEKCEHDVLLLVSMLMKMAGRKCKKKYHLNKTEAGATSPPASTLHMARIRSVLSLSYLRNEEPSKKTNKKKKNMLRTGSVEQHRAHHSTLYIGLIYVHCKPGNELKECCEDISIC